ncbi:unnamed protein product [Paramecium pentaurelia]|uniref:Uncharacterized protein n=1 Tax=Paramecium pentaurelia TaxID=43138 RepID=A0A8S1UCH9_9CILI|nr:unnamed protein product [Paramecium pentaurelia]
MGAFQIALISIIVFSSIQFVQYVLVITAYLLLIQNQIPYLRTKFLLVTLVALQNIGMMLVNEHQNSKIVNNTTCTIQALIIHGTQLSIYTLFLCITYSKCRKELNETSIISLTLITLSFMIIPLIMHQTRPGELLCEFDQPTKVILSTICSYIILVVLLVCPLLTINKIDSQLNKFIIIFTITQIVEVVKNTIDISELELAGLFFIQIRNFLFMLFFQIETKDALCGYCGLIKKPKKHKQNLTRLEECIPVRENEMTYKI